MVDLHKRGAAVTSPRPPIHFVGMYILAVGTLGFLAGFASPYWQFSRLQKGSSTTLVHGLWVTCEETSGSLSNCRDNIIRVPDWLRAVQALQCIAVLLLLTACVTAVLLSFTPKPSYFLLLDFAAGFGAVLATFGTLGYMLFTLSPPSGESNFLIFNWGFGINAAGSFFCALGAILIAASRACVSATRR
ncbi:hypothetical protein ACOMHN_019037 [Nucella lapillus]